MMLQDIRRSSPIAHRAAGTRVAAQARICFQLLVLAHAVFVAPSTFAQSVPLAGDATVRFASIDDGRRALRVTDEFVERLSPFDRSARTKTEGEVSTATYLDFVASQVREWTEEEGRAVTALLDSLRPKLEWVKAPWPAEVLLIKTSNDDEGGNPYTRGAVIILPENVLKAPDAKRTHVLLHELFHVLSRHNPTLRAKLYGIVGFERCKEVPLPEGLAPRRITNPDAPRMDVMIEVEHEGRTIRVAPVLLSNVESFSRSAMRPFPVGYLDFRFAELEDIGGSRRIKSVEGAEVLLSPMSIKGFFEKVGRNTPYVIHPEEILADNFVMTVIEPPTIPTPRVVQELRSLLAQGP